MTERDIWVKAGVIVAEHGALTADYIIDHISDVMGDRFAIEDWRRIARAVDMITTPNHSDGPRYQKSGPCCRPVRRSAARVAGRELQWFQMGAVISGDRSDRRAAGAQACRRGQR